MPGLQDATRRAVQAAAAPVLGLQRLERRLFDGRLHTALWCRRRLLRTLAVVLALLGSSIHFQRYPDLLQAREDQRAAARQQTISRPDLGLTLPLPNDAVVHGPVTGEDPEAYVEQRQAVLADLGAGTHVAIVSTTTYVSAADMLALLPSTTTVLRAQYRMPDSRSAPLETEVVGGDLVTSIDRIIAEERSVLELDEASQRELLESGTLQSEEFERDARNRLDEIRTIRNVLVATGAVVFAVMIESDAATLRDLARDGRVRLVDVLPEGADAGASVFFGLKPDDVAEVTFGVPA